MSLIFFLWEIKRNFFLPLVPNRIFFETIIKIIANDMPCLRIFSLFFLPIGNMEWNQILIIWSFYDQALGKTWQNWELHIINKNLLQELLSTNEIEVNTKCQKCLSIFDPKTILGTWKACIKPRPYYKRALLWLCISTFLVQIFISVSWMIFFKSAVISTFWV